MLIRWTVHYSEWHRRTGRGESCTILKIYPLGNHGAGKMIVHKYDRLKAMTRHLADFETYVRLNSASIVDYSERHRYGERVSTGFVESTVNLVIAKRFVKRQQMHWTKRGAHLLLQARTKVLNEEWGDCFRQRYPGFRQVVGQPVPFAA